MVTPLKNIGIIVNLRKELEIWVDAGHKEMYIKLMIKDYVSLNGRRVNGRDGANSWSAFRRVLRNGPTIHGGQQSPSF